MKSVSGQTMDKTYCSSLQDVQQVHIIVATLLQTRILIKVPLNGLNLYLVA